MSDTRETEPRMEENIVKELLAAGRSDGPRRGAQGRALSAVLGDLDVASAVDAPGDVTGDVTGDSTGSPRRAPFVGVMAGYLLVAAALVAGMALKRQDDLRATDAALAGEVSAQRARYEELTSELEAQTDHIASLRAALDHARSTTESSAAAEEAREPRDATVRGGAVLAVPRSTKAKGRACECTVGDPLCSCVP